MTIEVIPLQTNKQIQIGDNLTNLVTSSKQKFQDGDILILSQKVVSKQ